MGITTSFDSSYRFSGLREAETENQMTEDILQLLVELEGLYQQLHWCVRRIPDSAPGAGKQHACTRSKHLRLAVFQNKQRSSPIREAFSSETIAEAIKADEG